MDTAIAIDPQLLFGAGVENTLQYLRKIGTKGALEIINYTEEHYLPYDDRPLDQYNKGMEEYYSELKR